MKYHNITYDDMKNGVGLRVVLWVSGCSHKCEGCQNPITWDANDGIEFDKEAEEEIFNYLSKDYIDGVTFSGGDPLYINNRKCIFELIKKISKKFPNKTIWLYTGYSWEEIKDIDVIEYIDVIVDGEFIKELNDNNLHWKGSSNQRVIDVKESLKLNKVVLFD